jgi:hypothetical protein
MAYSDAVFNVSERVSAAGSPASGVSLGTSTASGVNTFSPAAGTALNGSLVLPKFTRPVRIDAVRVYCTAASTPTAVTMALLNGTSTLATVSNVGAAANATVDGSLTADTVGTKGDLTGPRYFTTAGGQPILKVLTTATASGDAQGSYAVDFMVTPLFTAST